MKKIVRRILILLLIFILALAGYTAVAMFRGNQDDTAYTSIEDANLPVVYMEMFGRRMNCLYGFTEENAGGAGRGDLTVLPTDRRLPVQFQDIHSRVRGIQYEIRSLDGTRLVERTALEEWNQGDATVDAVLPIQNLLKEDEEYRLTLVIATEEHPAVYYYTRIVWTQNDFIGDMVQLASDFSEKTFDYNAARELTTYLETDANTDNSSLGRVTLKNSFSQLTWRGMNMERIGEPVIRVKELQGIVGVVELDYVAVHTEDGQAQEYYDVSESFTMKMGAQRIYMMDYDRRVNEIFSGEDDRYSEKRILMGISDGEELQAVTDASGKYKAFVANRTLWSFDTERGGSTKVFAFRKSEEDLRTNFHSHGVKILSVGETGDIDFLVYGYMIRGNHEGTTGVALYRYANDDNTLTERLYLPVQEDYWTLKQDISRLSYLSGNQTLYILLDHTVYGVDLLGKEYMTVAYGLTEENFAVSTDGSRIAWQEGELYDSQQLNVMNLQDGKKDEIHPESGDSVRLIGFVGSDLVYGLARTGDRLTDGGRVKGQPLYAVEIVGVTMNQEARYEKEGVFLTDVEIQDSRVHLSRLRRTENGFEHLDADTLVCNESVSLDPLEGIGYLADNERGRLYYVQLNLEEGRRRTIRVHVPKRAVAEENDVIVLAGEGTAAEQMYRAYSGGRMRGAFSSFADAVQAAHDGMGLVTDEADRVLWVRANRSDSVSLRELSREAMTVSRYLEEMAQGEEISSDGTLLLDGGGLELNQVFYYIFKGKPVAAFLGNGSYCLITGYDIFNITCYWYPGTEMAYADKMGLNDAASFFAANGKNDFVCFLSPES